MAAFVPISLSSAVTWQSWVETMAAFDVDFPVDLGRMPVFGADFSVEHGCLSAFRADFPLK